jgi:hypothetical protein
MSLGTLNDVFADQIEDLYSAETQLVDALAKIANGASDQKLQDAFKEHWKRLVATSSGCRGSNDLGISGSQECKGMAALVNRG